MKASEFITELYEPKTSFPLNWYPSHHPSEASARAYDRNKGYIDIKFTPILGSDDMVEVEFSRNDSYDMTGGGDANRVLGTVLQAFREYLQGYQPKILVFSAKGASRSKVYQNLIKRFASTVGYKQFDISKLSPETQEKIAFSGSDLMVLRKSLVKEDIKPRTYAGNVQAGNYLVKIDQHLVDRAVERNVPQHEIISTMNKLSKAKAKLKTLAPGESFYIHDNTNGLYVLFYTLDSDRKVYIARTVWPHKKKDSVLPIIQVA
jgi:hypothetical protein